MCFGLLYNLVSETFLILRRIQWVAVTTRSLWLYNIFPHNLINAHDFREMFIEYQAFVLIFHKMSYEIFLILRRIHNST
jgi:hypothetical protein